MLPEDSWQKPESSLTRSNILTNVSALRRIEPRDGVIRVAGPPRAAIVIQELTNQLTDHKESSTMRVFVTPLHFPRAQKRLAQLINIDLPNPNGDCERLDTYDANQPF